MCIFTLRRENNSFEPSAQNSQGYSMNIYALSHLGAGGKGGERERCFDVRNVVFSSSREADGVAGGVERGCCRGCNGYPMPCSLS